MSVKRSVDFRMAPKKVNKGNVAAAEPTRDEVWEPSKCYRFNLESLVKQGFLASKSVIQWRPAFGDARPYENTGEIIGCIPYFERRLDLPSSNFFSGLLYHYVIQLHHLIPNSFVHISVFVCLCEAFLGIEPHFDLFCHLFHLKPQSSSASLDVVGGAGIQLR